MSIHVVYMLYVHGEQRAKENLHGNRTFSETKGIPMVCSSLFLDSLSFALLPLRLTTKKRF